MKRLRSFGDDGEKWDRRDRDRQSRDTHLERSSSYRRFNGRSRLIDDDWESSGSRSGRRRCDYDFDGFDRRRSYDRHRESIDRNDYGAERLHRSESFSGGYKRDFGNGYQLERLRREESVSSWRRLSGCKDGDDDYKLSVEVGRGSRVNVRSPQGSRETGRSLQGLREAGRSPQSSRDMVKSPPGSKDSVGTQLNTRKMKTSEDNKRETSSSSEMEEGELGPEDEVEHEHELSMQPTLESQLSAEANSKCQDVDQDNHVKVTTNAIDASKPLPEMQLEFKSESVSCENEDKTLEMVIGSDALQECHTTLAGGRDDTKGTEASPNVNGEKEENIEEEPQQSLSSDHQSVKEEMGDEIRETSLHLHDEICETSLQLHDGAKVNTVGLEVENNVMYFMDSNEIAKEENRQSDMTLTLLTDTLNGKDKGKSIAISQSSEANSKEISWRGKDLLAGIDDNMEGPSSRGFELFSRSTATRSEKRNYVVSNGKKLKTEPLELSLALPNVVLPLPSHDLIPTPSSLVRTRSVQSLSNTFRARSGATSGSMSFSGSQTFIHNPSCSLTQNSFENFEQSVGSHPLFQGADQQVSHIFSNEPKQMESAGYQISVNGNGCHASQTSNGITHIQAIRGQQRFKLSEGSTGISVGQDQESNLHRQLSELPTKNYVEVIFPTNNGGSRDTTSEFIKDEKYIVKERNGNQHCSSSSREMDKFVIGGIGFFERIIAMIISDPVQVIAQRIEEMAEQSVSFLKESACEIIVNKNMRGQLQAFQEALRRRSDLTVEILSKSHRAQLEILVAFKTGLQDFLQKAGSIPSADLAEIYNNMRCRNLACLSVLPVDDCDCKICVVKNGFCSMCTCLICSKFDMALNTCSWVGCDLCLHWCHTDCALQMAFVKNGRSVGVDQEGTEMQFHCVACNHPSEMFGFVKEVFKTCAKDWNVETLAKELEYVRRIFSASNDPRGKQLHTIADQMIARLEAKSNLSDVCNHIIHFLNENDTEFGNTPTILLKETPLKNPEDGNGVTEPTQVPTWLASASTENIHHRDSVRTIPSRFNMDQMAGPSGNLGVECSLQKLPVVDELESIIKIKHAEAKMFQARADEARKEAEGLKRIAVAKNEKIDEEFLRWITKLHLADAEEKRKQKVDELKLMEREHREYFSMKVRMESDIRVLLLKMEATKQNFGT